MYRHGKLKATTVEEGGKRGGKKENEKERKGKGKYRGKGRRERGKKENKEWKERQTLLKKFYKPKPLIFQMPLTNWPKYLISIMLFPFVL